MANQDGNRPTDEWMTCMDADLYRAAAIKGEDLGKLRKHLSAVGLGDQLTPQGNNLLHIAAQFGQMSSVEVILGHLHSSNLMFLLERRNLKGDTALHLAAREGRDEVVKALIKEAGAKAMILMTMKNKEGDTALNEAKRYNHKEVVDLLVKAGAGLTSGHSVTMELHKAIKDRSPAEVIKDKLNQNPSLVNTVDARGWSPLHVAALKRNDISAKEILKSESLDRSVIYLGIKDGNRTALHLASWVGCIDIVKLLLKHAPDCSEQVDADGRNVFHFAVMNKYRTKFASELLNVHELRVWELVNKKDAHGHTPFRLLANAPEVRRSGESTSSGYDNDEPFTKDPMVDEKERKNKIKYAKKEEKEKVKIPTLVKFEI